MTAEIKHAASPSLADRMGIWMSALCVVHCIGTPVLLSFSAVAAHFLPGEESTHRALATCVAALGAMALLRGFRLHGRKRILVCMALGLSLIFFGAWFGDSLPGHWYEVLVTVLGSSFMIAAHRMNHTFCQDCRTCTL